MKNNDTSERKKAGLIVSFYSYKGGVGRSMALANIAVLLARSGKKVLVVDWDLEAPGLDYYFQKLRQSVPIRPGGLLSLLESNSLRRPVKWKEFVSVISVAPNKQLDFLRSGSDESDYSQRLGHFSWPQYFSKRRGADVLERLREEWMDEYDFVLLDSRTGLTDASGVCTIQMPDLLVLIFAANEQNLTGCRRVADAARSGRRTIPYDRPHLAVLPVLSRFDAQEEIAESKKWMDRVAKQFAPFYADWLPRRITPRKMLEWTRLPYLPLYSFGETLAVLGRESLSDPQGVSFYYNIIARLLTSRFQNLRAILAGLGVAEATLEPLLPSGDSLRECLRMDPNYALKRTSEIAKFAADDIVDVLNALERLADYTESSQPSESEEILQRAVQLARRYAKDNPQRVIQLYVRHANLLAKMDRDNEAQAQFREALDFCHTNFGNVGPELVLVTASFAAFKNASKSKTNITEAESMYRGALECAERSFRASDPRLAGQLVSFSEFLVDAGRKRGTQNLKVEALEVLKRAVKIYKRAKSKDSAHTAALNTAQIRIHRLLVELGRYREALSPTLDVVNRVQKSAHQNVIILCEALEQYGWALEYLGRYQEAESCYRKSLKLKEKNWGLDSVRCGVTCSKLADVLSQLGRYTEAESFCRRALRIHEDALGPDDPETANNCANLAEILEVGPHPETAEPYLRRSLQVREQAFGNEHRFVALSCAHLGLLLSKIGNYSEAESFHRRALAIDERLYPGYHPEVAFDRLSLAHVELKQGKPVEADEIWRDNLLVLERALGSRNEQVAQKRVDFAEYLLMTDRRSEAKREIHRAIRVLVRSLGETHPQTENARALAIRIEGNPEAINGS